MHHVHCTRVLLSSLGRFTGAVTMRICSAACRTLATVSAGHLRENRWQCTLRRACDGQSCTGTRWLGENDSSHV